MLNQHDELYRGEFSGRESDLGLHIHPFSDISVEVRSRYTDRYHFFRLEVVKLLK